MKFHLSSQMSQSKRSTPMDSEHDREEVKNPKPLEVAFDSSDFAGHLYFSRRSIEEVIRDEMPVGVDKDVDWNEKVIVAYLRYQYSSNASVDTLNKLCAGGACTAPKTMITAAFWALIGAGHCPPTPVFSWLLARTSLTHESGRGEHNLLAHALSAGRSSCRPPVDVIDVIVAHCNNTLDFPEPSYLIDDFGRDCVGRNVHLKGNDITTNVAQVFYEHADAFTRTENLDAVVAHMICVGCGLLWLRQWVADFRPRGQYEWLIKTVRKYGPMMVTDDSWIEAAKAIVRTQYNRTEIPALIKAIEEVRY